MNSSHNLLQCGNFSLGICGNGLGETQLPQRIMQFCRGQDKAAETCISVQHSDMPARANKDDSWEYCKNGLNQTLTYFHENECLFSVSYSKDQPLITLDIHHQYSGMIALQHAVMIALAQKCIGFHGVTVICKDKAVILSAPSGTGKTTLAKLLQRNCEAAVVNGDFALLSYDPEYGLMFEPTPFCGSSGVCHNVRLPIEQIVFLEQGKTNEFKTLNAYHAMCFMMNNTFIPEKDASISACIQEQILRIVETVPISKFAFEPTDEAAHVFYKAITNKNSRR